MKLMFHWIEHHLGSVFLCLAVIAAIIYVAIHHTQLFYKE